MLIDSNGNIGIWRRGGVGPPPPPSALPLGLPRWRGERLRMAAVAPGRPRGSLLPMGVGAQYY